MIVVWGILLALGTLWLEAALAAVSGLALPLGLVFGISCYLTLDHRLSWAALLTWAAVTDFIYFPVLPITLASVAGSWVLWRIVLASQLDVIRYGAAITLGSGWLVCYYLLHWLLIWLTAILEHSVVPASWVLLSLLESLLVSAILVALLLFLLRRVRRNKISSTLHAQR